MTRRTAISLAVVGAGPVGLALAVQAARQLPHARVTVFDARPLGGETTNDARTLALSLGSVQQLQRLGAWRPEAAAAIVQVHVSQAPPAAPGPGAEPVVRLSAADQGVALLGAVTGYGAVVQGLQQAWLTAAEAEPQRLGSRFGCQVGPVTTRGHGVDIEVDGTAGGQRFDLAVVAEGGLFGQQPRKTLSRDYGQTAWVGEALLEQPHSGVAYERFTSGGPLALLPLPDGIGGAARSALVWCVGSADDPVRALDAGHRLELLHTLLPREAGRVRALSDLQGFPLGLNARRTLVSGRRVQIGNAAQTLHPVAGQGLNLGLRDAAAAVAALRFADDIDQALRRVEWARAPDRWRTIATTDLLARGFAWNLPGLAALRDLALAGLDRATPLKRRLARQMMFGWRP